jgi:SAM-dependent methyltransferase
MAKKKLTARNADRFDLYEQSVQCPEADVAFMDRVFRKTNDRSPVSLREDFCGSAFLCAEWVKSQAGRFAEGVDLDTDVLEFGRKRHIDTLPEGLGKVTLRTEDVLLKKTPLVDIQVAFNFSYCIFKERAQLLKYFTAVRRSLKKDGLFFLDLHGGAESMSKLVEKKRKSGFTYVWDQGVFEPIEAHRMSYIHFQFPDGTRLRKAFSYDWRIWSLPEIRDLLGEAGFRSADVYWEGTDRSSGEGNGVYRKVKKGENDLSYICYIVGRR